VTQFTFEPQSDGAPVWTPDGRRIAFSSDRAKAGVGNLYWQRSDGTGQVQRLTEGPNHQVPGSFHPSGKHLAYTERSATTNDLMILPLEGDEKSGWKPGKPVVFLSTPHIETAPMFSPDGRWIAYMSPEGGAAEIYVRPFPAAEGKWKISTGLGIFPAWSSAKRELFYLQTGPQTAIMSATFTADGESFRADKPLQWSPALITTFGPNRPYDLHPDGLRVAVSKPPEGPGEQRDKTVFIFNFFDELRRVVK